MPNRVSDLTGVKFGKLTAVKHVGSNNRKNATWLCLCECGKSKIVSSADLKRGNVKSCGCLYKYHEGSVKSRVSHGMTNTRIYRIWCAMKARCYNPNTIEYDVYGGRGISVCDEWNDFVPFFVWSMLNGYNDKLSIDRVDSDGNYCPENCQWSSIHEQAANRSNTHGVIGVKMDNRGKWRARIIVNRKEISKNFKTFDDAVEQRKTWEREFGIYTNIEGAV